MEYGGTLDKTTMVEAKLAGMNCECFLVKANAGERGDIVWLMVKTETSDYRWYVVGLQGDGSILRAVGCASLGFPTDERVTDGRIAIKQQISTLEGESD